MEILEWKAVRSEIKHHLMSLVTDQTQQRKESEFQVWSIGMIKNEA